MAVCPRVNYLDLHNLWRSGCINGCQWGY